MSFQEAVKTCFAKYADFTGRASRAEYWWWVLFVFLCSMALSLLGHVLSGVFSVAVLLPGLAVAARRLHDADLSAWWLLLALIPFLGTIALIVMLLQPTKPQSRYA